ncbi:peptidase U32 family protein [Persicirhabdus sediminis]|uniref:U32 family peptidase n=1 Tax=Persicirhabdus sediminis TaxID=454144 RepID=A0A8J7SJK2_9BACT|nr:U32 family peptidase [Persicirhabdus sediminis]MBK1792210.1 U32 family peptidase [Persicirhabdus sediminis]
MSSDRQPHHMSPELLSPAGNWDCARAAVANGADAIFFGLPKFNARLRADNFTEADLPELMDFLHSHGVRGFVTMNTLIFTNELKAAEAQLKLLAESNVDAIIVQDFGLARLARTVAPSLEIHASTQMTITSPEGLDFADALFKLDRAVLARELSLREIKKFGPAESVPIEVFVHGALCVAYSGQCLTSESLGQRSANRGECAQACRMNYELVVDGETKEMGDTRYLLSPQDLAAVDVVPQLVKMGVVSYKIEGRLKSPEYVAAVTRVYRKAIDAAAADLPSPITDEDRYTLEMVFSRGLSTGWLEGTNHPKLTHGKFGKKRGAYVGTVTKVDYERVELELESKVPLRAGDGVVFDAGEDRNKEQGARIWQVDGNTMVFHHQKSGLDWKRIKPGQKIWKTDDPKLNAKVRSWWKNVKLEPQRDGLQITIIGSAGQPMKLSCHGITVESSEKLEAAQNRPLNDETLAKQLGRLGGTDYQLAGIDNQLQGDVIMPLSALNRLRRALVEALDKQGPIAKNEPAKAQPTGTLAELMPKREDRPKEPTELTVLCRNMEQIDTCLAANVTTLYADFMDIRLYKDVVQRVRDYNAEHGTNSTIHLATPRIQKAGEHGYFKLIERAAPDGVLIRNLGAIEYFKNKDEFYRTGDFSLNCANPITADILKKEGKLHHLTVSYDLNITQVLNLLYGCPQDWFELTLHQHMPMFHMEHCVFCTFLSEGKSFLDCGYPCEKHKVQIRDRVGELHTLTADVGCRNTLFNSKAQTGARYFEQMRATGLKRFRIDLLNEDAAEAAEVITAYRELFANPVDGAKLWHQLNAMEKLGVTEGTLEVR